MSTFKSWRSYWEFENTVRNNQRYFHDSDIKNFLENIVNTCEKRKLVLEEGKYLWRAQLGHDEEPLYQQDIYIDDIPTPFNPKRMMPLENGAIEGRANSKGIPMLYTATTKETALAEVRPWLGALVSVGQFRITKSLSLIDCSKYHGNSPIYFDEPDEVEIEKSVWTHIDNAFSKPTTNSDSVAEYVPTQILSELFKSNNYDGIVYKSMLGEGYNVVLFDLAAAEIANCHLNELKNLSFSFETAANPYSVKSNEK